MGRARRLALGLLAAALLGAPSHAAGDGAPAHRILVMVRLAPEHYRPGSDHVGGGYGDDVAQAGRRRIAARIARTHGLRLVESWPMPLLGVDCFVMAVPGGRRPEAVTVDVAGHPDVAWSEALPVYRARGVTPARPDPLFAAQPAARRWRLAELHRHATGRGVTVAVIDSKVARAHPDLAGQVVASLNFVAGPEPAEEAHGTGVAGVIAASANNGLGIAGVAPRARLLGLRACRETPGGETSCDGLGVARALHAAIERGAQVINLSLGGPSSRLIGRLIEVGVARGATIVAAFDETLDGGGFPASEAGVIAVAAGPPHGHGRVQVAPGRDVPTTTTGGRWELVNGSSYAAAHVSGLVALLRERRMASGAAALVRMGTEGGGEIDACATLARGAGAGEPVCAPRVVASRAR